MREMTFPYAPARGRAVECKPSPRKGAAALPAELPAQPPQPPKYRQFIKLAICLKPQVCKAPEIAAKPPPEVAAVILPSRPQQEQQPPRRSSQRQPKQRRQSRQAMKARQRKTRHRLLYLPRSQPEALPRSQASAL